MVYVYVRNDATGQHLGAVDAATLSIAEHAGDPEMWTLAEGPEGLRLSSATCELVLHGVKVTPTRAGYGEVGRTMHLSLGGVAVDNAGAATGDAGAFTALTGPSKLPSAYVREMRETGWAILDGIMQPDDIAEIKAFAEAAKAGGANSYRGAGGGAPPRRKEPEEGRWGLDNNNMLANCPILAKCCFHPVAMHVIQQYLGVPEIIQSHIPSYTILKPAIKLRGERPPGGWHSDYPYRPNRFINNEWPDSPLLGVQYNICVDEFTGHNGATQFMPGSHLFGHAPTPDWNANGTRMGEGLHKDVRQVEAPAGAAFIYDARTWHRACPELNESQGDRCAILNSVLPSWIQPMSPRQDGADGFQRSVVRDILTPREVRDVEKMCGLSYYGELNQYNQKSRADLSAKLPAQVPELAPARL